MKPCGFSAHSPKPTTPCPPTRAGSNLVGRQPLDNGSHLLVRVYSETAVPGDAGELDVLGVELLLHDLLEGLEHERLGVGDGEGL